MKNLFKSLLILSLVILATVSYSQKTNKFGHLDFNKLYSMMPGLDTVQSNLEEYAASLQEQYNEMQAELENKIADYQAKQASLSQIIRQTKEKEITDLQARMDAFQLQAQEDLQNKEVELQTPIIERARQAIEDIAKEHGYTYILNSSISMGMVLYSEQTDNVMDLVKKKIGIE